MDKMSQSQYQRNFSGLLPTASPMSDQITNMNKKSDPITADQAIVRVGGNHLFQCYTAAILTTCFCITGMTSLGLPWLELQPSPISCTNLDKCNWDQACSIPSSQWHYDKDKQIQNWRTDFNLQCADQTVIALMGSSYFLGFMLTAPLWLRLADIYGRKKLIHISIVPHIFLTAAFLFLPKQQSSQYGIIAINACLGLKQAMTSIVAYVLLSELVSAKYRSYYSAANNIYDGFQNVIISVIFYYSREWKNVTYYYLGVLVVMFITMFMVPQSPRYYMTKKQFNKARAIYAKIARINKKEMFQQKLQGEDDASIVGGGQYIQQQQQQQQQYQQLFQNLPTQQQQNYSSLALSQDEENRKVYKNKRIFGLKHGSIKAFFSSGCKLWAPLVFLLYMWLAVNVVYYGIALGIKDFKGNILVNSCISAIADIVGYSLAGVGANVFGRKPSLFMGFVIAAIACGIYSFFHRMTWAVYTSVVLGKLGISFCFNVMYIITSETFPTQYRGTVFGISNFFARGGGFLAPFIEGFFTKSFMFIFMVLSAISAATSICLTETKNLRMIDSLDDYLDGKQYEKKKNKDKGDVKDMIIEGIDNQDNNQFHQTDQLVPLLSGN